MAAELEASVPAPPLDFRPLKPPTRGPAAGQVIDTLTTPVESNDSYREDDSQSDAPSAPLVYESTAITGLTPALINRMKTLDFRPLKAPTRGPRVPGEGQTWEAPVASEGTPADAPATTPWVRPIPAPPLDFKPMRPPTRGPLAQAAAAQAAEPPAETAATPTEATDLAAPAPVVAWTRPIPAPPLDFKPMRPPTRGPLAQAAAALAAETPAEAPARESEAPEIGALNDGVSAASVVRTPTSVLPGPGGPGDEHAHRVEEYSSRSAPAPVTAWTRPIPPPPLDFKPMRPPTRGPLAQAAAEPSGDAPPPPAPTDWSSRPVPPPPLDFKPLKPPTRGPLAQKANIVSPVPPLRSAAAYSSRPIPAPPLDFKPNVPPTRGLLATPQGLAEMAAAVEVPTTPTEVVTAVAVEAVVETPYVSEPEPAPAVAPLQAPTVKEVLAPTPIEPVRPAAMSLAEMARRTPSDIIGECEGVG